MDEIMNQVPEAVGVLQSLLGDIPDNIEELTEEERTEKRKELVKKHYCGLTPDTGSKFHNAKSNGKVHTIDAGTNSSYVKMPLPAGGAGPLTVLKPVATATAMNGAISAVLTAGLEVVQIGRAYQKGHINGTTALWQGSKAAGIFCVPNQSMCC